MRNLLHHYREVLGQRDFFTSVGFGFLLFGASLYINFMASSYASRAAGSSVSDLILDHLPALNVDVIYIQGAMLFFLLVVGVAFSRPRSIPFLLKTAAMFIVIRSFSIMLTHLGPPAQDGLIIPPNSFPLFFGFHADLFFSGHAGFPFLMALVYWKTIPLRIMFLTISFIFAMTVLFGHFHYSIDVFAAYFITFGIFRISEYFFVRDHKRLHAMI